MTWHPVDWYLALVAAVACERVVEMVVARRNLAWSLARGGTLHGRAHYPAIVLVHVGLLIGCVLEVVLVRWDFIPPLGWAMLGLTFLSQGLRWWCIATLGHRWNTRIVVLPGRDRIVRGPYRWMPHPNYAAVAVEGAALPLVGTAWITALVFGCLNLPLLAVRIRAENQALRSAATGAGRPS